MDKLHPLTKKIWGFGEKEDFDKAIRDYLTQRAEWLKEKTKGAYRGIEAEILEAFELKPSDKSMPEVPKQLNYYTNKHTKEKLMPDDIFKIIDAINALGTCVQDLQQRVRKER